MEPNGTKEFRAVCQDCVWKGNKLANRVPVETEAKQHEISMDHTVEIVEIKIVDPRSFPEMSEEEAKLLFIRKSATEAFEKGEIKENTGAILRTIVEIATISTMTKEDIAIHIGNLERARSFLAAFTQGLQIGYAAEVEPKIKARREKEKADKILAKSGISKSDKRVNELIELAKSLASLDTEAKPKQIVTKQECPSCKKEVFSLKFHKC